MFLSSCDWWRCPYDIFNSHLHSWQGLREAVTLDYRKEDGLAARLDLTWTVKMCCNHWKCEDSHAWWMDSNRGQQITGRVDHLIEHQTWRMATASTFFIHAAVVSALWNPVSTPITSRQNGLDTHYTPPFAMMSGTPIMDSWRFTVYCFQRQIPPLFRGSRWLCEKSIVVRRWMPQYHLHCRMTHRYMMVCGQPSFTTLGCFFL